MHLRVNLSILFAVLAITPYFEFFTDTILSPILTLAFALISFLLARNAKCTNQAVGTLVQCGSTIVLVLCPFLLVLSPTEPRSQFVINLNEAETARAVYLLARADVAYAAQNNDRYVSNLSQLAASEMLRDPDLTDARLARDVTRKGSVAGYTFSYSRRPDTGFQILASPQVSGKTGIHSFYIDNNLKLHWDYKKLADSQSPMTP